MNSSDADFLRETIESIATIDCDMEAYRLDNYSNSGEERLEASLHSRENIIAHFVGMTSSVPDSVFLIHEWKIFARPNRQSCLVFKFSMTGTQMFEFESPCTAEDHTTGYQRTAWVRRGDPKRAQSTVMFREGGRTGKYDARRRNKIRTIGEYVDCSKLTDDYSPSVDYTHQPEIVEHSWGTVHDAVPIKNDTCILSEQGESPSCPDQLESVTDSPVMTVRRHEVKKVNVCGVMRFHINADHKVWKIHCVHIHDM